MVSLNQYLTNRQSIGRGTYQWLVDHPEIRKEVDDAIRSHVNLTWVCEWLRSEHGFPFKHGAVQSYARNYVS